MTEQQCWTVIVPLMKVNVLQVPGFSGKPVPSGTAGKVSSGTTPTSGVAGIPVPVMLVLGKTVRVYKKYGFYKNTQILVYNGSGLLINKHVTGCMFLSYQV